TKIDWNKIL
nr:Chain B, F-actin-capping protein subunit alpha-2 [Bos taurus]